MQLAFNPKSDMSGRRCWDIPRGRIHWTAIEGEECRLCWVFLQRKNANGVGVGWGAGLASVGSIGFKQESCRMVLKNLDFAHTNTFFCFGVYRLGIFCQTVEYESKDLRAGNLLSLDNQHLSLCWAYKSLYIYIYWINFSITVSINEVWKWVWKKGSYPLDLAYSLFNIEVSKNKKLPNKRSTCNIWLP